MEKAQSRLLGGTVVYMIGSFTSKFLQLLVLPLITAILLTDEYGYYDLIISTTGLVLPIATLKTLDAVFRFLFNADEKRKKEVLSAVALVLFAGVALLGLSVWLITAFTSSLQYPVLIVSHFASFALFDWGQKTARSSGLNKQFAVSGVLHTVLLLGTEAFALLVLNMRVDGLLWGNVISNIGSFLYLNHTIHLEKSVGLRYINKSTFKELLKFSIPLIPNSISWWFISMSNRYIVAAFLGVGSNGIYSIANKFPQLLTFATSVFQLAWQESAILESGSGKRNQFYSNVFDSYIRLLLTSYLVILMGIRIIVPHMISQDYMDSMNYIPILLYGSVAAAVSQFYGTAYVAMMKTKDALSTTIVAALINVGATLLLIRSIGLYAPAIATALAFTVQWLHRQYQMRHYFQVKVQWKTVLLLLLYAVLYYVLYARVTRLAFQVLLLLLAAALFLVYNKKTLRYILTKLKKR